MPKFKPCNYDQMTTLAPAASAGVLPISLENQILPGSLEHTIHEVVEKHIDLRAKRFTPARLAMVEPVFANMCVHKHMNRFTLRSKAKVDVQ